MRPWLASALIAIAFVVACKSSFDPSSCPLPAGFDCCDGDVAGEVVGCRDDGLPLCSEGTFITPSAKCTIPRPDGGLDAGPDGSDAAVDGASGDAANDAPHE
jgi:hypothetical protein